MDKEDLEIQLERFWEVTHPYRCRSDRESRWRKDAPPLRAMISVHCGVMQDLDHIGDVFEWLIDESGEPLSEYLEAEVLKLENGVYIWEGTLGGSSYQDYFGEYDDDYWLKGEFRLATKEEWQDYVSGDHPWDVSLWQCSSVNTKHPKEK